MKKKRQAEILRIISANEVETQEMLLNLLKQKGYDVTQATVSRDINELNIEKTVSSNGVNCYAKAEKVHTVKFHNIISEAVVPPCDRSDSIMRNAVGKCVYTYAFIAVCPPRNKYLVASPFKLCPVLAAEPYN